MCNKCHQTHQKKRQSYPSQDYFGEKNTVKDMRKEQNEVEKDGFNLGVFMETENSKIKGRVKTVEEMLRKYTRLNNAGKTIKALKRV